MNYNDIDSVTMDAATGQPSASMRSSRGEPRKFFRTLAAFLAGLMASIFIADRLMGMHLKMIGHRGILCPEVRAAVDQAGQVQKNVRFIVLGDSVGHQLFMPGTEGRRDVLFLTSNAAISVAGQCYLAESAMDHCPALGDIYLVYLPFAWVNNLPPALTHDYFCGNFHTAGQVIEVLKVKRDFELSFAHAGRWMLPNLMAANSLSRRAFSLSPMAGGQTAALGQINIASAPDPERLITQLSAACAPAAESTPPLPQGCRAIRLSPVSRYYLTKLRAECQRRGVRLHIVPSPVSDEHNGVKYVDTQGIYDVPIIGDIPAVQLRDGIHFKREFIQGARNRMIREYELNFLTPGLPGKLLESRDGVSSFN
jgi:hypothetical protein